jgi:trimeric autotransporter adhesin
MKRNLVVIVPVGLLVLAGSAIVASAREGVPAGRRGEAPFAAAGSDFTYQGRLKQSGDPANGLYDLQFTLYDAASGGSQVGSSVTVISQTVADGLFTLPLDFGATAFQGSARWLQIEVRPGGSGGAFTVLAPRQALKAAPYALSLRPGAVITGTTGSPVLSAANSGAGHGLYGASSTGSGVYGEGTFSYAGYFTTGGPFALYATSTYTNGAGVEGVANNGINAFGVVGASGSGGGVYGFSTAVNGRGVYGVASNGTAAAGVWGSSASATGVYGTSTAVNGWGVYGVSGSGVNSRGVYGESAGGYGVYGQSTNYIGIYGTSVGADAIKGVVSNQYSGVAGVNNGGGYGVWGTSAGADAIKGEVSNQYSGVAGTNSGSGYGVYGSSSSGDGVHGVVSNASSGVAGVNFGSGNGIYGSSATGTGGTFLGGYGVYATSNAASLGRGVYGVANCATCQGVRGQSTGGTGVYGQSDAVNGLGVNGFAGNGASAAGVFGSSSTGLGVWGSSVAANGTGVLGNANSGASASGVSGTSGSGRGVYGFSSAVTDGNGVRGEAHCATCRGVYGESTSGYAIYGTTVGTGLAGYFNGSVRVTGNLTVTGNLSKGGGSFKIDHPLDPENKYLYHSFVESPDMMNIYNGNVILDAAGEVWVQMPDWFEALNRDFRYQLTSIGGFAPVYVAEKLEGNRFKIAGGKPGMEVSWQVTGIRRDPYAETYRIPVEQEKPAGERGYYLHPELYGESGSRQAGR